ncbi:NAD-dependent epimerase/dehydratase family protein [Haloferax namakaokahaiae]|uniref:NAD-dependent epimerase/dehydratase family protein n=1 Tax=Haloferax namakaokahaiae TaxID=1748331 RepID=A0ABD5ZCM7_9EURY
MTVFVTGSTGVLGRRLVERLVARGYDVDGLVRDDAGAEVVESRGGTPVRGDVLDHDSLVEALTGVETVVHAATSLPVKTKPTDADWERNDRVRVEGARNLVAVAGQDIDRFLFPSIVWLARQPDGSAFDEDASRHPDRATASAATVEDYLRETAEAEGFDATILRCGFFYAPDAGHTRDIGESLLSRDVPIVGGGLLGRRDATLSLLHADDAAGAFADAIDAELSGLYHVVDDEPATFAEFIEAFADRLGAPSPRRIPGWLARFIAGRETVRLLTNSMPTSADRFKAATGWEPQYPTYRAGLDQVIETWRDDGTIRNTADGYEWVG